MTSVPTFHFRLQRIFSRSILKSSLNSSLFLPAKSGAADEFIESPESRQSRSDGLSSVTAREAVRFAGGR